MVAMFIFTFSRYIFNGSSNSYKDNAWKYELSILDSKIEELHKKIVILDIKEIEIQQRWIDKLIKKQKLNISISKYKENEKYLNIIENIDFTK